MQDAGAAAEAKPAKKRVFISYSSRDAAKADEIRAALEGAGVTCWIAPRDLASGSQWGGGIVQGIEACEAMLVVFSSAANDSPQIVRELELAVSNRKPLIPVRIEDATPTDDMKYFLGVSHWFDAFAQPLVSYLPAIVLSVSRVLAKEATPWRRLRKMLPRNSNAQLGLGIGAAVLAAIVVGLIMRPNPFKMPESPLLGRWTMKVGGVDCVLDVQGVGQARFGDACPMPLTGASGNVSAMKGPMMAPNMYRPGDTGTLFFQGGSAMFYGAWKKGFFGGLTVRTDQFGELKLRKISNSKPMENADAKVLPANATWPLDDMPGVARRATEYARSHWKPDAVLLEIDLELAKQGEGATNLSTPQGQVRASFRYYSPATQEGMQFTPNSQGQAIFPLGVIKLYSGPLPDNFLDLDDAVRVLQSRGMQAKQIKAAELSDWGRETQAGSARMSGVAWMIDSTLDERFVVPATP